METLPIIDLTQGIDASVAEKIGEACHEIGFLLLAGHGISQKTIGDLRQSVIKFFDQPQTTKMSYCVTQDNYRGYIPLGFFTPNASGDEADCYEGFKLHGEFETTDDICRQCDLYGPNEWPQKPVDLQTHVKAYWDACDHVARILLGALSHCMGLPPNTLQRNFDNPLTNMTLLHYPPSQEQVGIHPHKDTDALTIL
ncbi:MAG: 2-oxoglutarate and iron-dependent oxygenase domain-containing protein, partial [Pseudomonadota bacterium]